MAGQSGTRRHASPGIPADGAASGPRVIVQINPFQCCMWDLHDRLDGAITEESCRGEIESFIKHGQLVPVLARPLADDRDHKYELIYGARRLFVARHLNRPLMAELKNLTDLEGIVAMDAENRLRSDVSAYERGISYSKWLQAGVFKSQEEIALALHVSASQVSRLIRLAHLPSGIVDAFESPAALCERWAMDLMQVLEDPSRGDAVLRVARAIASTTRRPPPREVFRRLMGASAGRRVPRVREEIVKNARGRPLFRVRSRNRHVAVLLPRERVSASTLLTIRATVAGILQGESPEDTVERAPDVATGEPSE